jgi:hypothetical protein
LFASTDGAARVLFDDVAPCAYANPPSLKVLSWIRSRPGDAKSRPAKIPCASADFQSPGVVILSVALRLVRHKFDGLGNLLVLKGKLWVTNAEVVHARVAKKTSMKT